jgi:acyl-[acyl-carrier-protein]-phospholipid O-acyltransferase / long-chain-fatty-acid--[acyl-carrier-protein] ligase
MAQANDESSMFVTQRVIREWKRRGSKVKIADSMGSEVTGTNALIRTLILRRLLLRKVLGPDEQYLGLLLPPSAGATMANVAVALCGRVSVNLNYTVTSDVLNECIKLAGIKHVLTSRRFMEKMNFSLNAEMIYLEDFKDAVTWIDKISCAVAAKFMPASWLDQLLGLTNRKVDDPLTVIFTSGSTGVPKGVVLTYGNINHNVTAIGQAVGLNDDDVVMGILPFFHSFGYTVTLWSVMALPPCGVFHFNPLEARQVGKLCEQYGATVLLATPTFLTNYIRRVEPKQFEKLQVVIAGAEKLPVSVSDAFEDRFKIRPVEGYGTTELSPLVSVNIPPTRDRSEKKDGWREGSVGRPVIQVQARIISLDEPGKVLPTGESGMLQIKGPNVMKGYLHREDLTAKVLKDGWYETGDVAFLDPEGFIHITGRQSRFSKIGGEMVPHIQIEETIGKILGVSGEGDETGPQAVITAVPDPKRGERLIVLHTKLPMSAGEIIKRLQAEGLPNLYLPSEDSFLEVEQIPVLGTGKLDLRGMQQLAKQHFSVS